MNHNAGLFVSYINRTAFTRFSPTSKVNLFIIF